MAHSRLCRNHKDQQHSHFDQSSGTPLASRMIEMKKNQAKQSSICNTLTMSSLATTAAANSNPPGDCYDDELQVPETPSESPNSKGLNQMDTKDGEELGKHLDELVNSEATNDTQDNGEISFSPGHSFFRPPSYSRALVAQDLWTPDLPCIFWASIRIPLPHPHLMQQTPCSTH